MAVELSGYRGTSEGEGNVGPVDKGDTSGANFDVPAQPRERARLRETKTGCPRGPIGIPSALYARS